MLASIKMIRELIAAGKRPEKWDLYQMSIADEVVEQPDGDTYITLSDSAVCKATTLLSDPVALAIELAALAESVIAERAERKKRLKKANTILRVRCPILTPPEIRSARYMACLSCEHAGRDDEGGPITCGKCGCGSDPLRRRWRVLDAECGDRTTPRWQPGENIIPSSQMPHTTCISRSSHACRP